MHIVCRKKLIESNSLSVFICVFFAFALQSCRQREPDSKLSTKQDLIDAIELGDFELLASKKLPLLCGLMMSSDEPNCKHMLIESVCSQGKISLRDALSELLNEPTVQGLLKTNDIKDNALDAFSKEFLDTLKSGEVKEQERSFKRLTNRCLNPQKVRETEEFMRYAETPEFKERAKQQTREFWLMSLKSLAKEVVAPIATKAIGTVIQQQIGKSLSRRSVLSLKALFGLGVCSAGAYGVAEFMSDEHLTYGNDSACKAKPASVEVKSRMKACTRTIGSVCDAFAGVVDMRNLGLQSENEVLDFLTSTANFGIGAACYAGGKLTSAACGFISASANQIGQALKTGNNDWATCVGTAQMGRCIGEKWGQGGWSNSEGIEFARKERGRDGIDYWVRRCCTCKQVDYEQTSFITSKKFLSAKNILGVIQKGDYKSGNCAQRAGKIEFLGSINGVSRYSWKESCEDVDVLGSSCSIADESIEGIPKNSVVLWNQKQKLFDGRLLRLDISFDEYRKAGGSISRTR